MQEGPVRRVRRNRAAALAGVFLLGAAGLLAQEISPRAYWPAPAGTRVLVLGYAYSSGDVLMDPTLPIYGVESRINTAFVAYLQYFSLWGRTANVLVEQPYSWGVTKGFLYDLPASRELSGASDLAVTLAVNLFGAPTMTREDFRKLEGHPRQIVGASLKVVAPTGNYEKGRLINVGSNRWAAKLELGHIIPLRPRWLLELEAGVTFFGDDEDFLLGVREQEPIFAGELHLVKRFTNGWWLSMNANYYSGGRTTTSGVQGRDFQRSSRLGATIVIPFRRRHAVKLGYGFGALAESGTDYDRALLSYQVVLP